MQIAGQTNERGEGAWRASKLRPDGRQEGLQYLLIFAELTSLPGEKPLGNGLLDFCSLIGIYYNI